jgi:uncharacterized membrane protein
MRSDELTAPSRTDSFVREASGAVGGPVGKHTRFGAAFFWTPARVLVLLSMVTFLLGFVMKAPCSTHPWSDNYQYTRLCYSDVFALYFSEGIVDDKVPYVDHPVEYPVVIGGLMWVAGTVSDDAADFYNATAAIMLICAVATTVLTSRTAGRRRPWDAALFALAPGIVLHGTTNWDLAAVALTAAGMWAWSRRQPELAGLFIGLGIATKLYPIFLIGALFVLCVRGSRIVEWARFTAVSLATVLLVYIPVVLVSGTFGVECKGKVYQQAAWRRFLTLNECRAADWDSVAFAYQKVTGHDIPVPALNTITAVGVGFVCALVWLLVVTAPRRPRVAQVMFLLVAGFLLVNKVNSPQYTVWLIPLAALARPRWGAFLAWQGAELLVLFTRFYYFVNVGDSSKGIEVHWFLWAVGLRNVLLLTVMGLVVREMFQPYHDVVRRDGEDDPGGGVLDGALDRRDRASYAPAPAGA